MIDAYLGRAVVAVMVGSMVWSAVAASWALGWWGK
jgi:hypothetical protein